MLFEQGLLEMQAAAGDDTDLVSRLISTSQAAQQAAMEDQIILQGDSLHQQHRASTYSGQQIIGSLQSQLPSSQLAKIQG